MSAENWFSRNPKKSLALIYLLFLALAEILLRLGYGDELLDRKSQFIRPTPLTHHDYRPGVEFTTCPYTGDDFPPAENRINSYGIRGPEPQPKKHYRILCVGDSFVQADEVPFERTFGQLLDRHFHGRLEFISHGMVSWSPTTEFSWIHHRGLRLEPDEVLLFLCINDFYRAAAFHSTDQVYRRQAIYRDSIPIGYRLAEPSLLTSTLRNIALVRLLHRGYRLAIARLHPAPESSGPTIPGEILLLSQPPDSWPEDLRRNVDETAQVIADLHAYLQARDIPLTVTLVPLPFSWPDEILPGKQHPLYGWDADFSVTQDGLEGYLRRKMKESQIPWLDLQAPFAQRKREKKTLLFNPVDGHWNAAGHRVVFETLEKQYSAKFD